MRHNPAEGSCAQVLGPGCHSAQSTSSQAQQVLGSRVGERAAAKPKREPITLLSDRQSAY